MFQFPGRKYVSRYGRGLLDFGERISLVAEFVPIRVVNDHKSERDKLL